jgi:hypothetical protein
LLRLALVLVIWSVEGQYRSPFFTGFQSTSPPSSLHNTTIFLLLIPACAFFFPMWIFCTLLTLIFLLSFFFLSFYFTFSLFLFPRFMVFLLK